MRTDAGPLSRIEHIWQTFWRHGFYRGGPVFMSALSGIDIALWDLKGEFSFLLFFTSCLDSIEMREHG